MGGIRAHLLEKFEFHSYGHALEILEAAFPGEWEELQDALERFTISLDELRAPGATRPPSPRSLTTCSTLSAGGRSGSPGIWW